MRRTQATPKKNLKNSITDLGLGSNLILCLDAGAGTSYDGSSQVWTDLSGNGADFYRGATSGAEASDASFVGTAGNLSSSEYFTFDGGDYFIEKNAGWGDDAFHTNNATFTIVALVYLTNISTSQSVFHNYGTSIHSGVAFNLTTTGLIQFKAVNGSGNAASVSSTAGLTANQWSMLAISVNESSTTGGTFFINGTTNTFNPTYASPSAGACSFPAKIGVIGNVTGQYLANNTRIAGLMAWSRALPTTELASLYADVKSRRLTTLP